ncbi:MAG TPA: Na+/H+ antiporter subunit D, partial [Candidatus Accumulibacter sp.]|nr:Na+/H+ antiporter subunit D [Accumulibacter sp.]
LLVAAAPLLAIFAGPLGDFAQRTASQLHAPGAYVAGVLGAQAQTAGHGAPR